MKNKITGVEIADIVGRIVEMPRTFNKLGNISIESLLVQTGYFTAPDQISEPVLRQALMSRPEFIRDWIDYSEGKRSSDGWYITQPSELKFEVGVFDERGRCHSQSTFSSVTDALAHFIKREIEDIRECRQTRYEREERRKGV